MANNNNDQYDSYANGLDSISDMPGQTRAVDYSIFPRLPHQLTRCPVSSRHSGPSMGSQPPAQSGVSEQWDQGAYDSLFSSGRLSAMMPSGGQWGAAGPLGPTSPTSPESGVKNIDANTSLILKRAELEAPATSRFDLSTLILLSYNPFVG